VPPVLEVSGLTKVYRRARRPPQKAVDRLELTVPEGGVFGFLGPNGSGKTTTIRMVLGLVRQDAGRIRLLGADVPRELPSVIGGVGALVEAPQFFPTFSGRRNLELLARVAGVPASRIDDVLEQVGLATRQRDRVKSYSLGMKQRLGIAAALLKQPRLLILDEPSNGLDPAGIREVRELIRSLGRSGVTVCLSSHLLAEVEQVCDSVAIIRRGSLVTAGPVQEVLASRQTGETRVVTADLVAAATALTAAGLTVASRPDHLVVSGADDPGRIAAVLGRKRIWLHELTPLAANLESVFLDLTADEAAPPPAGEAS
jgi:ABC-2 type transport system ATP-binding protein